jgi:hypothetical protein
MPPSIGAPGPHKPPSEATIPIDPPALGVTEPEVSTLAVAVPLALAWTIGGVDHPAPSLHEFTTTTGGVAALEACVTGAEVCV